MTKTAFLTVSALALAFSLGASQASAKVHHPQATGQVASQAQLQREHNRAVKAGDTANDPFDSSSSDALNQQQLAGAPAPSMASAPMTDANTGISSDTSAYTATSDTGTAGNTGTDTSTDTSNDNTNNNVSTDTDTTTLPPADQPSTPIQSQDNGSTSMPSSSLPGTTSMPQSQLPTSSDTNPPQTTTSGTANADTSGGQ